MGHPDLGTRRKALEERIIEIDGLEIGPSVLTAVGLLHLSAKGVTDELRTIADAQHRNLTHELAQVHFERLRVMNRIRRSAQYHTNHRGVVFRELVVRQDLTESIKLADTPAYELRGLRTEIQNNYLLLHIILIKN